MSRTHSGDSFVGENFHQSKERPVRLNRRVVRQLLYRPHIDVGGLDVDNLHLFFLLIRSLLLMLSPEKRGFRQPHDTGRAD